jgi:hypothetical protein
MEDSAGLPQRERTGRRRKNHEAEENLVAALQSALPGHRAAPHVPEQQGHHKASPEDPGSNDVGQQAEQQGGDGHEPSCSYECE